jgi:uncharacterized DUF497 family protein
MVYTDGDGLFDWDGANVEHIARHGVTPEEVEEALSDEMLLFLDARSRGERRWLVIGVSSTGRMLSVVFTRRGRNIRIVTARDADQRERRAYRRRR